MKTDICFKSVLIFFSLFLTWTGSLASEMSEAMRIVDLAEKHTIGKTFRAEIEMQVDHSGQKRDLKFKFWAIKREKTVVKITYPKKDKDSGNLRMDLNLWQYLPNIDRIVKIPPSMMLQNWMGSDFTNDDIVKASSLTADYTHRISGKEKVGEFETFKIQCIPKSNAPVTWGKVVIWIRIADYAQLRQEYFTEEGELVKSLEASNLKQYGTHIFPSDIFMRNMKKIDWMTSIHYENVVFDDPIPDSIFTQEFLRKTVR